MNGVALTELLPSLLRPALSAFHSLVPLIQKFLPLILAHTGLIASGQLPFAGKLIGGLEVPHTQGS